MGRKVLIVRPKCKLSGEDGNVFNIIGRVSETLKQAGLNKEAAEFREKAFNAEDYDHVLALAIEYTTVV